MEHVTENHFDQTFGTNTKGVQGGRAHLRPHLGRVGRPDEVADAVLFLASDQSTFITGIELFADGGRNQI